MTPQAATAERNSAASEAKLRIFEHLVRAVRDVGDYESARAVRDELTRWAPWAINLHIWDALYDALSSAEKREQFQHVLEETASSLEAVLARKDAHVPAELFGDVSEDVRQLKAV